MGVMSDSVPSETGHHKYPRLGITNFGPISKGVVTVKPLTVFLGPNGCGKSHMATLVYTIIKAELLRWNTPLYMDGWQPTDVLDDSDVNRVLEQYTKDADYFLDDHIYNNIVNNSVQRFFDMLSDALLTEHKNLIRKGAKCFVLDVASDIIDGKIQYADEIKFDERNTKQIKFVFKKQKLKENPRATKKVLEIDMPYPANTSNTELQRCVLFGLRRILRYMSTRTRGIYFPAERSGLTMAQRSITLHYYNTIENAFDRSPDPDLASVATDFLSFLIMPTNKTSNFVDIAECFEKKALRGSITAEKSFGSIPDIKFVQNSASFSLNTSASSVKDMAVFILYLKHAARRGDTIIFEEPETCLHPDNQALLAKLLAQLVNNNFRIIVTTHSPFFVEQLSNCVVAGTRKDRSGPVPDSEKLDKEMVAAYGFVPEDGGYKITPLDVDDEGIPQYEFTKVYDRLYNELLKLEGD